MKLAGWAGFIGVSVGRSPGPGQPFGLRRSSRWPPGRSSVKSGPGGRTLSAPRRLLDPQGPGLNLDEEGTWPEGGRCIDDAARFPRADVAGHCGGVDIGRALIGRLVDLECDRSDARRELIPPQRTT
jgi:hypothetical protein